MERVPPFLKIWNWQKIFGAAASALGISRGYSKYFEGIFQMWPLCRSTFLHLQLSNSCPTSIRSKVFLAPGGNNAFNPTLNWCKIFKKSEMLEVCWCFFFFSMTAIVLLLQCYKMPSKVRIGIIGSISCSFISGYLQNYLSGQIWDMRGVEWDVL